MTLVKFKNPNANSFNNLMNDFLPGFPSLFRNEGAIPSLNQSAPVNIKATEKAYELEVVAPGFGKEDFKISVENNLLVVSAERKAEEENKNEKHLRREFNYQSFKRSFTLDEKLDAEKIDAKYVNGVLKITIPKKEEIKAPVKQITIE